MARTKRTRTTKALLYFFLEGKIHKSLYVSRAKDEVTAFLAGKIQAPTKIYPISNPGSTGWSQYMLTEEDILKIHQFILDDGYSSSTPSRTELVALLRNDIILYTKTTDGRFIPVWKAED